MLNITINSSDLPKRSAYFKTVNGKKYGPYYRVRPVHKFSQDDLCRIARYVMKEEQSTEEQVIIKLIDCLGLERSLEDVKEIIDYILDVFKQLKAVRAFLGDKKKLRAHRLMLRRIQNYLPRSFRRFRAAIAATRRGLYMFEQKLESVDKAMAIMGKVEMVVTGIDWIDPLAQLPPPEQQVFDDVPQIPDN